MTKMTKMIKSTVTSALLLMTMQVSSLKGEECDYAEKLPIVKCSFIQSQYERVLMTILRDKTTSNAEFRAAAGKLTHLLVNKVVECFPSTYVEIETPLTSFRGETIPEEIEIVSIMRSGDALVDSFISHFPKAKVNKILVQRDEETAKPQFIYMKMTKTIASGQPVVITEPMIATGGSLDMVIGLLKEKGVLEKNIIIASVCTAFEGLLRLNEKYPEIQVVMSSMDLELNENMYIVPGLGDFGDRFFGTNSH